MHKKLCFITHLFSAHEKINEKMSWRFSNHRLGCTCRQQPGGNQTMTTQTDTRIQFPSGIYYVPSRAAIVDSLFTPGGTASGHFKVGKHGVTFYDMQGNPEFFLAAHRSNKFFVSCHRVQVGGKNRTRYLYALDSLTEAKLGIDKMGHYHEHIFAESVWQSVQA